MNVIDACKADGIMRVDIDPETLIDAIVGTSLPNALGKGRSETTGKTGCSPYSGPP